MAARIEQVVTAGTFSLDGGTWEVDNNVWLVGDEEEVLIVDAAHDPAAILTAVGARRVVAVVCTHGHDDHVNGAPALREHTSAPVWFPAPDTMLWEAEHPHTRPDSDLAEATDLEVAGVTLTAIRTPGHSPGSTCLYAPKLGALFSGDTLFAGGPGATGRSFSDFATIIDSIRERLLRLPGETVVYPGHGDTTTIGAEVPHLQEWIDRGH